MIKISQDLKIVKSKILRPFGYAQGKSKDFFVIGRDVMLGRLTLVGVGIVHRRDALQCVSRWHYHWWEDA